LRDADGSPTIGRVRTLLATLALLLFALPVRAEEMVRIAIVDGAKQITLAGRGLEVRKLEVGERYAPTPGGRSVVYLSNGRLYVDGAPVDDTDGVRFRSRQIVRVADKPVRGQIEIRRNRGALIAINVVPLEDYLAAVLGSEMPKSFPVEALKAQAVAARTYAIQRKISAWGKPYHLGATVLHQVYGGTRAEDPRTRAAVDATRGEVLTWKMEPIEAYFHSSCGGRTESGRDALGRDKPYLKPVACECHRIHRTGWTRKLETKDLASLAPGVKSIRILERTSTGRAKKIELVTNKGRRTMSGVQFRQQVGYDRIRSLQLEVTRKGGAIVASGKGYGHGAGMCQWGARALAEKGWDYRKILAHYYDGAELRKMY
jgi:stage II sporulation protein D